MAIDLVALKAELENASYAGKSDEECANLLAVRDRRADRTELTAALLMGALDEAEYNALVARGKAYWGLLVSAGSLPLTTIVKQQLSTLFPNPSNTRTNLLALLTRPGTRAEELNLGGQPTPSDVANARRL